MSLDVMVSLAREVAGDIAARTRIEALSDEELARLGLDDDEVRSIRDGFFDHVLRMGISLNEGQRCCGS
jgi:hypothetical protein